MEGFGGDGCEVFDGVGGVSLVLEFLENVLDAGVNALGTVVGDAGVDRYFVGGLEADAVDFAGGSIGLGLEDGGGFGAELFVDA